MIETGRMPASNITLPFAGENIASVLNKYNDAHYPKLSSDSQALIPNKYGHNPYIPTAFRNQNHKGRPYLIVEATRRSKEIYHDNYLYPASLLALHEDKFRKDKSKRKKKSQIRSPLFYIILPCIFHFLNLQTFIIGFFDSSGKFLSIGIKSLFHQIQKSLKEQGSTETLTYKRLRMHLRQLQLKGYIEIKEKKKILPNGKFISREAEIKVNPILFSDLGFSEAEIYYTLNKTKRSNSKQLYDKNTQLKKLNKATAKKNMKDIRQLLTKKIDGRIMTEEEKKILNKEYPGHDRIRTKENHYPDYTGISKSQLNKTESGCSHSQIPKPLKDLLATFLLKPDTPH